MRGLAFVVIAVAACTAACRDGGVVIVVDPMDPAIAHVRLYVGQGDAQHALYLQTSKAAATVTAPTATRVYDPVYWSRDPNNSSDIVDVTAPDSVSFTFVDAGQHGIPAIIAVGYDVNFKVLGTAFLSVPTIDDNNQFVVYHVPLRGPVSALDGTSQRQLGLWSTDAQTPIQDADCAGLVVDSSDFHTRSFIVTNGDQDCDGLPTGSPEECDPDAYLSVRAATPDEISCLSQHLDTANMVSECYLGGPSCTDGAARDMNACNPTRYCVPLDVCTSCPAQKPNSLDCAAGAATAPSVTSYTCHVGFMPSGDVCPEPLVLERPPTGGYNCNAAKIRGVGGSFDDHVEFGMNGNKVQFDLKLDQGCNLTFQPSGKKPGTTLAGTAVIALELDNSNGLGIPVAFVDTTATSCGTMVKCTVNTGVYNPELTQCMAQWQPPTMLPPLVSDAEISDPTLPDDMTELFFVANDSIVVSARDPNTNNWMPPTLAFAPFGANRYLSAPNITPDGKTMYFVTTDAAGLTALQFVSTRPTRTAPWTPPMLAAAVPGNITVTEVSPEETETHFIIAVASLGTSHLAEVVKNAAGMYSSMAISLAINSTNDISPNLSPDGLHLYFASDAVNPGDPTTGFELYVASRNSLQDPFIHAVRLAELGTGTTEDAPWVSRDGHTMYFVSARSGSAELYVTHR